jgi:hypothetical protein
VTLHGRACSDFFVLLCTATPTDLGAARTYRCGPGFQRISSGFQCRSSVVVLVFFIFPKHLLRNRRGILTHDTPCFFLFLFFWGGVLASPCTWMGHAQSCVDAHDGDGARPSVQSYLTPACMVCRGMIIPGDRTAICRGGCQHMARLRSAGVARDGETGRWKISSSISSTGRSDGEGEAYGSARAALEAASGREKRPGIVYEYTSKVHRSCMSSQRIRVAPLGPGKQTLCKHCVAFHNFNSGRSSTSERLSAYCMERAQLDRERTGQDHYPACSPPPSSPSLECAKPELRLTTEPTTESGLQKTSTENQQDLCNRVIIAQVEKQRDAHHRRRESLKADQSKNMAVLKQACQVALAADARACACKDASRMRFLQQDAKFAYLFVNQCVPDAIRAAETLRCHIVERTHDYCYDPREKESDAVAASALDESVLQLCALQRRYKARTAFFQEKVDGQN